TYPPTHVTLFLVKRPPPTHAYALSLHDALPIFEDRKLLSHSTNPFTKLGHNISHIFKHSHKTSAASRVQAAKAAASQAVDTTGQDRKSTRLNSSHGSISYAVFCLKKKTPKNHPT